MNKRIAIAFSFLILSSSTLTPSSFKEVLNGRRLQFVLATLRDPSTVGSVTPSSRYTGDEMTRFVREHSGPKRILEVGAGPASGITKKIIASLNPEDEFIMVEINPLFCQQLHEAYGHLPNVTIIEGDILEVKLDRSFDYILSSLPLTVFPAAFIQAYYKKLQAVASPGAIVSYIEYIGLRRLRGMLLLGKSRKILSEKSKMIDEFKSRLCVKSRRVFRNSPPTWVHHLQVA